MLGGDFQPGIGRLPPPPRCPQCPETITGGPSTQWGSHHTTERVQEPCPTLPGSKLSVKTKSKKNIVGRLLLCFWQCYQKNNDGLGRIFRKTCWVFLITSNRYFICPNKFLERFFRRQHYHLSSKSQANSPPAACRPLMTRPQPFPVTPEGP